MKPCDCIPTKEGFYFATHSRYGWRTVVQIGRNGNKHIRAFCPRFYSTFDLTDFHSWSRPLRDPGPRKK